MALMRMDREGKRNADGSRPVYADWIGGPTLSAVRNCRVVEAERWNAARRGCADAGVVPQCRRSVRVTGEPLTVWALPAVASVGGRRRRGELRWDEAGPVFVAYSA